MSRLRDYPAGFMSRLRDYPAGLGCQAIVVVPVPESEAGLCRVHTCCNVLYGMSHASWFDTGGILTVLFSAGMMYSST